MQPLEEIITEIAVKAAQQAVENAVPRMMAEYLKIANHSDEFLTVNEALAKLKVTRPTLYAYFKNGSITKHKIGGLIRVANSEIDALLVNVRRRV